MGMDTDMDMEMKMEMEMLTTLDFHFLTIDFFHSSVPWMHLFSSFIDFDHYDNFNLLFRRFYTLIPIFIGN